MVYKFRILLTLTVLLISQVCSIEKTSCNNKDAIVEFAKKEVINTWPAFYSNPYQNQTEQSMMYIKKILSNTTIVCAIKYNNTEKQNYYIKDFNSKEEAEASNFTVTHQGPCGACSTLRDLSLYMKEGLTAPVRKCGFMGIFSMKSTMKCLKDLGFTDSCSQIWMFNTVNTREKCFYICMYSWISREPNTKPDGSLNDCLQCDEDLSGPIFKFYSGRTRRNSGIQSEIHRPDEQIYNLTHCYY
jgi:hypothetical protein